MLLQIAIKVRCATMIALYDRLLTLPQHQLSAVSSGQLINFITTDVDRIVSFITSFHAFWSMPLTFAVALYLLYREVGLAFLTGLGCALILVPINVSFLLLLLIVRAFTQANACEYFSST